MQYDPAPLTDEQLWFRNEAIQEVNIMNSLRKDMDWKMRDVLAVSRAFNAGDYPQAFRLARMKLPNARWLQELNPDAMAELGYKRASSMAIAELRYQYRDMSLEMENHLKSLRMAQVML